MSFTIWVIKKSLTPRGSHVAAFNMVVAEVCHDPQLHVWLRPFPRGEFVLVLCKGRKWADCVHAGRKHVRPMGA